MSTETTTKIPCRGDFALVMDMSDLNGMKHDWLPGLDFCGHLRSSGSMTAAFHFCRRGATEQHCLVDPVEGTVTIIAANHQLPPGRLTVDMIWEVPDIRFPDGIRRVPCSHRLDAELTRDGCGCHTERVAMHVSMPVVYESIYRAAAANGYEGEQPDFYADLAQVSKAAGVSALLSDVAAGKARIAGALSAQEIPTSAGESLEAMAEKVLSIHKAVEGDPAAVTPRTFGGKETLLEFMHNNRRADMPYMTGIDTWDAEVSLHGADAYLCSDGFPATGECGHVFTDNQPSHYVICYFSNPNYTVPVYDDCLEVVTLGGDPSLPGWGANYVGRMSLYAAGTLDAVLLQNNSAQTILHVPETTEIRHQIGIRSEIVAAYLPNAQEQHSTVFDNCSNLRCVDLRSLRIIHNGHLVSGCGALQTLSLPGLEVINGGNGIYNCAKLKYVYAPALEALNGGYFLSSCNSVTTVELDALRVSGGTVVSSCAALTSLALPALETLSGGTVVIYSGATASKLTINLPKLKNMDGDSAILSSNNSYGSVIHINIPQMIHLSPNGGVRGPIRDCTGDCDVHIHLGQQQDAVLTLNAGRGSRTPYYLKTVTIEPGFRSALSLLYNERITSESLATLIANLGDNNGNATLTLTLGAANIAKLDEDIIALAQAKNYTIV